jgi:hypothetical protein
MESERRLTERSNLPRKLIGIALIIVLAHFIFTNFSLDDWPKVGFVIKGQPETCTEIRGPKTMTDTVIEQLDVDDTDFRVLRNENKAVITIRNRDTVEGDVRVRLYCVNGAEIGDLTKRLDPGESALFNFLDVPDCDLDYYVQPDTVKMTVNRTVQVSTSACG